LERCTVLARGGGPTYEIQPHTSATCCARSAPCVARAACARATVRTTPRCCAWPPAHPSQAEAPI